MTLKITKLLCNEKYNAGLDKTIQKAANEDENSHNEITSFFFSGAKSPQNSFTLKSKITLESEDAIKIDLKEEIHKVRVILKEKSSLYSNNDIIVYLCSKYLKEANSYYEDKKYQNALNKYEIILKYLLKTEKDEKLLEDIQNIIASCYCGLGVQEDKWKEKIKNYEHGLQYARSSDLIKNLNKNKVIAVVNMSAEANELIGQDNYNKALDVCKKILELPFVSSQPDHATIKVETKKLIFVALSNKGKKALKQADRNHKIDKYQRVISLFKEALDFTNEDSEINQVNEYIALAFKKTLNSQCNRKEYTSAIETCKEGLKYTQKTEIINIFKTKYIAIFEEWKKYINKKNSLEQYLEYQQNLEKAESDYNLLSYKVEVCHKISKYYYEQGKFEEALEYINKVWEIFKDPDIDYAKVSDKQQILAEMGINKIMLHFNCYDALMTSHKETDTLNTRKNNYKESLKHMEDVLENLIILVKREDISTASKKKFTQQIIVAHHNIMIAQLSYLEYLTEKEKYELGLEIIQEILHYNPFQQTVIEDIAEYHKINQIIRPEIDLKIAKNITVEQIIEEKSLEHFPKIIEHAPTNHIIKLNLNPYITQRLQINIIRVVARHLHKIGMFDEAIEKYNQILESNVVDEVKQLVKKEKSKALSGIDKVKKSESLTESTSTYESTIAAKFDSMEEIDHILESLINHYSDTANSNDELKKIRFNSLIKLIDEIEKSKDLPKMILMYEKIIPSIEPGSFKDFLLSKYIKNCYNISKLLCEEDNLEEALEYIDKAWQILIELSNVDFTKLLNEKLLDDITLHKTQLHFSYRSLSLATEQYEVAFKHMEEVVRIIEGLIRKMSSTGDIVANLRALSCTKVMSHAQKNIIQDRSLYMGYLAEKGQYALYLIQMQEILTSDLRKLPKLMITEGSLIKISETLEHCPTDQIVKLNINPDIAKHIQVDTMRVIARHLHKIGMFDEAIEKYNQILESSITSQVKQLVEKEKSKALIGLVNQAEKAGDLLKIIATCEEAIELIKDSVLKDSLHDKYYNAIEKFRDSATKTSNNSIEENSLRAQESETVPVEIEETASKILGES